MSPEPGVVRSLTLGHRAVEEPELELSPFPPSLTSRLRPAGCTWSRHTDFAINSFGLQVLAVSFIYLVYEHWLNLPEFQFPHP